MLSGIILAKQEVLSYDWDSPCNNAFNICPLNQPSVTIIIVKRSDIQQVRRCIIDEYQSYGDGYFQIYHRTQQEFQEILVSSFEYRIIGNFQQFSCLKAISIYISIVQNFDRTKLWYHFRLLKIFLNTLKLLLPKPCRSDIVIYTVRALEENELSKSTSGSSQRAQRAHKKIRNFTRSFYTSLYSNPRPN